MDNSTDYLFTYGENFKFIKELEFNLTNLEVNKVRL